MKQIAHGIILITRGIGESLFSIFGSLGKIIWFFLRLICQGFRPPFYGKQIRQQLLEMGFFSLPLVALTALFTGMVLALQSYTAFSRFGAEQSIPDIVVLSITRELGPVLCGLMIAGRLGASIAAEMGTMRVTEQIDALKTLSTNPMRYLVFPRVISGMIVVPLLTVVADLIGVFGGYLVSVYRFHFFSSQYIAQTLHSVTVMDITSGIIKGFFFGFIVAFMGCYQGYYAQKGAEGVGQATTKAVVSASILILFSNYLLTAILFS